MTIHREGYKYILIASVLWAVIAYLSFSFIPFAWLSYALNIIVFFIWIWVISFFRIPNRTFTTGNNTVTAPADGKVVVIEEVYEPEYYKENRIQVSIFMSPLNVHVNRCPIDGTVKYMKYHPGKYLVAWHPKASTDNERTTMVIENGRLSLLLRQVAGALARRICYYVKEGDVKKQNDEYGFIRFGSRVDVYFPLGTQIDVAIGQAVKGGITVLATV